MILTISESFSFIKYLYITSYSTLTLIIIEIMFTVVRDLIYSYILTYVSTSICSSLFYVQYIESYTQDLELNSVQTAQFYSVVAADAALTTDYRIL